MQGLCSTNRALFLFVAHSKPSQKGMCGSSQPTNSVIPTFHWFKLSVYLGADGQFYLDRMENAPRRMQDLIVNLLMLSRVTTEAVPVIEIDLNEAVRDVISNLEPRIGEAGGHIRCDVLPTIEADPAQMRQLFQNVIGNALKFQGPAVGGKSALMGEYAYGVSRLTSHVSRLAAPPLSMAC